MALSDKRILKGMRKGTIVIEPFQEKNLSTSSYDVCLGEWFYREQKPELKDAIFNIYDPEHVKRVWGEPQEAPKFRDTDLANQGALYNIGQDDRVIILKPGETILGHTKEFIGGRVKVTSMMKARSSLGRSFILVCKCLHPDTKVRTAYGKTIRISELKVGESLINARHDGKSRVARVKSVRKSTEAKRVITFTTQGNRSITVSEDHLFKVSTSDGVSIMAACDINMGDALPVLRQAPRQPGNANTSPAECALIGYFLAEGNWQKYRLSFAKLAEKTEQRNEIIKLVKELFPNAPQPILDSTQIMFNSVDFAKQFQQRYPEMCQLAEAKRIPEYVMNTADNDCIKAFLKTYMLCDAHMDKNVAEIEFTSRSEALIYDLAYLTARLGACPTRFTKREGSGSKGSCTSSYYYGEDAHKIGHPLKEKVPRSWSVRIPGLMRDIKNEYGLTRAQLQGYDTTSQKAISRNKLNLIVTEHSIPSLLPYSQDLIWDEVKSITKSEVLQSGFVDISLDVDSEDNALFTIDNGLMTLNCAGWGDVGYINRWTMEITNVSTHYSIPLLVGSRIAQLVLIKTGKILDKDYGQTGNYQKSRNIKTIMESWTPDSMLPKNRP